MLATTETIFDPMTGVARLPDGVAVPHASEWAFHPNSGAALPKACHVNGWFFVRKSFDGKTWVVANGDGDRVPMYGVIHKTRADAIEACNELARFAAWNARSAS